MSSESIQIKEKLMMLNLRDFKLLDRRPGTSAAGSSSTNKSKRFVISVAHSVACAAFGLP